MYSLQLNENKTKKASLPVANPEGNGVRMGAQRFRNTIQQNQQEVNGQLGTRYSLGHTTDGKQVVVIESDIFADVKPGEKKHKIVADYIKQHIGEVYTIIESGQKVYIGKALPGEYTRSKYTQRLAKNQGKELNAKNQSIQNFGELIEIATDRRWEKTKHQKHAKDAKYGFYKYRTKFALQNGDGYAADLVIRNDANGRKYLYDQIAIKKDGSTLASTHNGSASRAEESALDVETIYNIDSISQKQFGRQ